MSALRLRRRLWIGLMLESLLVLSLGLAVAQTARFSPAALWMTLASLIALLLAAWAARSLVGWALRPLAGASTVIEALRDGDFSLRLRQARLGGLDELAQSINLLAERMSAEALDRRESGLLLGKILDEIELPVLAFRDDGVLTLSNPAARSLIGLRLHEGIKASTLGMEELLEAEIGDSLRLVLPGGSGRFVIRRRAFRLGGIPHVLLVLAEVGGVLSAERNEAWQGLVRVMSHEINNSLSPIKSLAESWRTRIDRDPGAVDPTVLRDSLELIERRAGALSRFVGVYASLARLPEPERKLVRVDRLIERVAALEGRLPIRIDGESVEFALDADQFEQALINLLRNAVEAAGGQGADEAPEAKAEQAAVEVRWRHAGRDLQIEVLDTGPGPPPSDNLFVPFFTTKPGGSGIGLLLVRRIAELHGGDFELLPRSDAPNGACARLRLAGPA